MASSERPLEARSAVVTGASSGIGRAIAETLGGAGAHVVLGGRTLDAMEASVKRITDAGGSAEAHVGDIRDPAVPRALVEAAVSATGRLDIMVNNAGVSYPDPILSADPEGWRVMLETNILALLVGTQAAVAAMRACGAPGYVVNISSVAALRRDSGVYGSTKHAVNCISETLRQELQDDPIKVVTIMPGGTATSFARNFDPALLQSMASMVVGPDGAIPEVVKGERLPDDVTEAARAGLPDHLSAPQDIAAAVLWAVTQPATVHVSEVVVRPNRDLHL
ncbi:MAG: SDR family oxidoreductase [Acidimicrobiales bacterium]